MKRYSSIFIILAFFLASNMCGLAEAAGVTSCETKSAQQCCDKHDNESSKKPEIHCCDKLVADKQTKSSLLSPLSSEKLSDALIAINAQNFKWRIEKFCSFSSIFSISQSQSPGFLNRAPPRIAR